MNNNFGVFVDLENTGGKIDTFNSVIETVKIKERYFWAALTVQRPFTQLKESLLSNTFYVTPSIKFGNSQKNNMDIQLVIDALETPTPTTSSTATASCRGQRLHAAGGQA